MYCMFIWLLGPLKVVTVVSSAQKPAFYVHMCSLAHVQSCSSTNAL